MLVRIVLNSEVAIVYTILTSYFASVLIGNQLFMFISPSSEASWLPIGWLSATEGDYHQGRTGSWEESMFS